MKRSAGAITLQGGARVRVAVALRHSAAEPSAAYADGSHTNQGGAVARTNARHALADCEPALRRRPPGHGVPAAAGEGCRFRLRAVREWIWEYVFHQKTARGIRKTGRYAGITSTPQ